MVITNGSEQMTRRRYKTGIDRQQGFLLPASVEEYVSEENPVRAIDAYIESLDLGSLGFTNTRGELTAGQPSFPPQALLKLYLYGYLHRVRSSRQLEQECQRNLEVIWLMQGLRPVYKTIANFRKDNLKGIQAVNRDFVQLCKDLDLFGRELVAIDGSFFRGNVGKKSIYTEDHLKKTLKKIEQHIDGYLHEMEEADAAEAEQESAEKGQLQEKLAQLKERQQAYQERLQKLQASGEKQLAEVDEDARLLSKKGSGMIAGYNVQTVVDEKHKLIVTAEVTQEANDQRQLEPMALEAKAVLEVEELKAATDGGYFNAVQIKNCLDAKITPYVPEPDKTAQVRQQGRFGREAFSYQPDNDTFLCPAGKVLKYKTTHLKGEKKMRKYASQAKVCAQCPLKDQCLPPKTPYRQLARWEHEAVIESHRERMHQEGREMMATRACLAEHPFGTLKRWCGSSHFLLRGLAKVRAEMNLLMFAYNFKRVLHILGQEGFRKVCLQRA
jgi:transposase